MFKFSKFSTGFVVGFGTGFITRDLMTNGPSIARPVVKSFMKAGVSLLEKTRESVAGFAETLEDLLAEVRSEHFTRVARPAPATASKPATTKPAAAPAPEVAASGKTSAAKQSS